MKSNLIGKFIKEHRAKMGLSQGDISKALGYKSPQFVSNWERGLAQPPLESLAALVRLLKLNENELMEVILSQTKLEIVYHLDKGSKKRASRP